jgi:hypothetical protein
MQFIRLSSVYSAFNSSLESTAIRKSGGLDFTAIGAKKKARNAPIVENNEVEPWILVRSPAEAVFEKPYQHPDRLYSYIWGSAISQLWSRFFKGIPNSKDGFLIPWGADDLHGDG